MQKFILIVAFFFALVLPLCASENTLASIKAVYVGSMGQSDESERFRILLEGELAHLRQTARLRKGQPFLLEQC